MVSLSLKKYLQSSTKYLFQSNIPFLYPLKTSDNSRFSDVFNGHRNVTLVKMGYISPVAVGVFLSKLLVKLVDFVLLY